MAENQKSEAQILAHLNQLGIPFTRFEHAPKFSIADCLMEPGLADIDRVTMPRNLLLCNRQQTAFYLLLLRPLLPFRTAIVSKQLGSARLSFAPDSLLPPLLSLSSGALNPLSLIFDPGHQIQLVMDSGLLPFPQLWFHPGVNTASLEISTHDFLQRFLPSLGRKPLLIHLPEPTPDLATERD